MAVIQDRLDWGAAEEVLGQVTLRSEEAFGIEPLREGERGCAADLGAYSGTREGDPVFVVRRRAWRRKKKRD